MSGQAKGSGWLPGGWFGPAHAVTSPNRSPRAGDARVALVVLHSISLPPGRYGGDAIERLFTNRLADLVDAHPSLVRLSAARVSAHFLVRRDGALLQFVGCDDKAWHAGESQWRGRPACNDYSVGIELEGLEGLCFESRQYDTLIDLLHALAERYPIDGIAGHEHIAPGRKRDPGAGFDWGRVRRAMRWPVRYFPEGTAPAGPP